MLKVPRYYESVLQAITHWVAYKREYFSNHLLPEGAVVAELTQLLSAKTPSDYCIRCEVMYKEICPDLANSARVDIAVYKIDGDEKTVRDVIEVKRYESTSDFKKIMADSEKLSALKGSTGRIRLFQIVVGQKAVPKQLITEGHNCNKKNIYQGDQKIDVRARINKKAYGTQKSKKRGVYALLLEVL